MAKSGYTDDTRGLLRRLYDSEPLPVQKRLVDVIREALRHEDRLLAMSIYESLEKNLTSQSLIEAAPSLTIVWDMPASRLRHLHRPLLVACIELTDAATALELVRQYLRAGIRASHIVVAGNLREISEDDYYAMLDEGVLLYHVDPNENVRQAAERALRPLYESVTGLARPAAAPAENPLTHVAAPQTMSLDELNAWLRNYSSTPSLD